MKTRKIITPRDLTQYYTSGNIYTAIRKTIERARPDVTSRIGKWTLLRIVRKPRSLTLQAMVNERGEPILSLEKRTNGTISFREYGEENYQTHPSFGMGDIRNKMLWFITEEIVRAMQRHAEHALSWEAFDSYNRMIKSRIKEEASRLFEEAIVPHEEQNADPVISTRNINKKNFKQKATDIMNAHFFDQHVIDMGKSILGLTQISMPTYNALILNKKMFRELHKASPNTAIHYLRNVLNPRAKPVKFKHPGQVVQLVKNDLKLTPAEWGYFCRISQPSYDFSGNKNISVHIRQRMRMLAKINQPQVDSETLKYIIYELYIHDFFQSVRWGQGDASATWTNILSQYLKAFLEYTKSNNGSPVPENLLVDHLHNVSDALRGYIEEELPWGPGDWENILARSDRWHQELNDRRQRDFERQQMEAGSPDKPPNIDATWVSLIPDQLVDDIRFKPLCTSRELQQAASLMNNCLHTYSQKCERNNSRVFTVHRNTRTVAAAELVRTGDIWQVGQVEGCMRRRPSEKIRQAVRKIRDTYQEAYDRQKAEQTVIDQD